ncbi:MarR family transcriptional regulator [Rhodococcoides kyotonense]|uniref:MarR family winged helix-turn-helix transcriptional regulator n=1 Tax=Rhodococcoides kyotonense TaxID=398843 RepID=UPI000B794253
MPGDLFVRVGRFRRQLRRVAGRSFEDKRLTESQAELLRLVGRRPGTSVGDAAFELGLAANTASTLVSQLATRDLLQRTPDPDDRRIGRLALTPEAQEAADRSRSRRHQLIGEVLQQLTSEERHTLIAGLDVLETLTDLLHEREIEGIA